MTIDLDRIVAIELHTHAEIGRGGEDGPRPGRPLILKENAIRILGLR